MVSNTHRTAVLLDPHPLWLDALESILRSIEVTVVGRTTSPEDALELVDEQQPDILICETETLNGGMSGSDLIRACREQLSTLRVIVLGASRDHVDIDAAFDAGALAYAVKTAHPEDVAATVRQTFQGALDALVEQVRRDRSVLAAVLCGSLSHDTVWEKSDIDLVFVTIDDKKVGAADVAGTARASDRRLIVHGSAPGPARGRWAFTTWQRGNAPVAEAAR